MEKLYAGRGNRREGSWPWLLQRVSGLAIAVLLFVHLWTKHFSNPGKVITFQGSAERLQQPWWLLLAVLMIAGLLFHSFYGLRSIVMDYITGRRARRLLLRVFVVGGILFFFVYLFSLMPFIQ